MDLRYTDAEQAFRDELRAWLDATLPGLPPKPSPDDWPGRRAYDTHWQRLLFDAGYAGVDWPVEGGGRGSSAVEELIFKEELERAHAPYVGVNFVGLLHAGPTVIAEGTPEQRARFLPAILRGDEVWCQGFSEPERRERPGLACAPGPSATATTTWSPGQKIWTSHAEVADYCELLVRTGPEDSRHRGISWLILPMDSPGVDIRPLHTIAGSTEFAELFLDEVRVPVANRVGEENDGWRVTMVTLSFERGTAFVGDLLEAIELLVDHRRPGPAHRRLGRPRRPPPGRPPEGRARRPVGPDQAQRLPGGPHRDPRGRAARTSSWPTRRPATSSASSRLDLLDRAGLAAHDLEGTDGAALLPAGHHGRGLAAGRSR